MDNGSAEKYFVKVELDNVVRLVNFFEKENIKYKSLSTLALTRESLFSAWMTKEQELCLVLSIRLTGFLNFTKSTGEIHYG